MPTIFRAGPYRFFFYAGDRDEPLHVHVEREDRVAKFWLDPTRFCYSSGFRGAELLRVQKIIQEHQQDFMEAWHDYFGS